MLALIGGLVILTFVILSVTFRCYKGSVKFSLSYEGVDPEKVKTIQTLAVLALSAFLFAVGVDLNNVGGFAIGLASISILIGGLVYIHPDNKQQSESAATT